MTTSTPSTLASSQADATPWPRVPLGEVCHTPTEKRDPRVNPDRTFRYVDIASVDNRLKQIIQWKSVPGRDAPSRARKVIRCGDAIVSMTRPNLNAVARVPEELDDQICSTGFCVLRANDRIDPRYLFAFVQSPYFVDPLTDMVRGALYPAVKDRDVFFQRIPLPPLSEQRRIAARLDEQMAHVARARAAAQAQLATIDAMPAALLRQAFKGAG